MAMLKFSLTPGIPPKKLNYSAWTTLAFPLATPRWDTCLDSPVDSWDLRPLNTKGLQRWGSAA